MQKSDQPRLNLFLLSWPIFIEQVAASLLFFIDGYFLSLLSDQVAAVVGQLHPLLLLGFFVLPVFSSAGTAVAAQYLGAKQASPVIATYIVNILLNVVFGVLLSGLFFLFANDIGGWLGMNDEQSNIAATYLYTLSGAFIFLALRVSYGSVLAAKGLTQWSMFASLITHIVNIMLNAVLVWGLFGFSPMGIQGIALASVVAYALSAIIVIVMVHVALNVRFSISVLKENGYLVIKPLLRIGVPTLLEPVSYCIQQIFIATLIISLGVEAMASQTYTFRLLLFVIAFCWAIAGGAQIMVAYYMGQQKYNLANRLFYRCLVITMTLSSLIVITYVIFYQQLLGIFTDNQSIKQLAMWMLIISVLMEPARAVNIVAGSLLKSVGDAKFTSMTAIVFIWGIIPIVFFIQQQFLVGILVIWCCFALDEFARACVNIWRWRTGKWKRMGVVQV